MNKKYCYMCKHWGGDNGWTTSMAEKYPDTALDWDKGFPGYSQCNISHEWAYIYVFGDAIATLEVPGNFCCVLYENKEGE